MSGVELICAVCKNHYLEPGTELERKLRYLKKWGPILATSGEMTPVCPKCEAKVIAKLPADFRKTLKENILKSKRN